MSRSTAILHVRVWPKDKANWNKALRGSRKNLSQFVIEACNEKAERELAAKKGVQS